MKFNKLYVPINSVNLGHYFAKGCVCPASCLIERNPDIQSEFNSGVLICKKVHTENTDCSIEIQLTDEEIQKYSKEISAVFLLYITFIPISRVSKIIFKKKEQAKTTIYDINQVRAFIPDELVEINSSNVAKFSNIANISFKPSSADALNKYNRLLGGFALMRLGKKQFQNYPMNYFYALSCISNPVKSELLKVPKSISELINENYEWLVVGNGKYKNLYDLTYSKISEQTFFDFAKEENVRYEMKFGRIDLDSIDKNKNSYLIAILASYNNKGTRRTLDNFLEDLNYDKFPTKRKEGISLMFGISKGYDAFRNYYKTENFTSVVKFKLDTILDYYIIESIYQHVMSLSIENDFSYISHIRKISADKNRYNTYSFFDNDIIYEVKEDKISFWNKLKNIFFSEMTSLIINVYEQKLGFKLYEEQKHTIEKACENIFYTPLDSLFQSLEKEQNQLQNILSNKDEKINELKVKQIDLWKKLREISPAKFDLMDTDHDMVLTNIELNEYISNLKELNYKIPKIKNSSDVEDFVEPQFIKIKAFDLKGREDELNRMPLEDLKKIGKKYSIKHISNFKKENKPQLIKLILEEEITLNKWS